MDALPRLDEAQRAAVVALVDDVTDADGVSPLNEEARLALGRDGARHWLLGAGGVLVGYAQADPEEGTAQVCVAPAHRRQGHGRALVDAVRAEFPQAKFWAFGDSDGARALASVLGLTDGRDLLIMARPLPADVGAPPVPEGVRITGFRDEDAEAFLAVNAAAFADHPEQGHFSLDDLRARQAEDWWDPAGLLMAWDEEGLLGFHWTKRHPGTTGEVYVLGVAPRAQGLKLGKVLLQAGCDKLSADGCDRVILYVDGGNTRAVHLYERADFEVVHRDVLYG
ncbi:mycothiol synthase [Nigerium massiliense]|uniref:mycothiol synthase n=1 Tax=Nigerium massiliense TaxID=1522317 RepID=UPI0006931D75|nr:mycothiol synthase [Nigerium massiliense]